jgi:diguanylate cyclase (GGDEF)-like protein/PAS domain S-box-containing protein
MIALAAIFIGAVFFPPLAGWMQSSRTLELSGLVLAAILTSALRVQESTTKDRAIMPPSFVVTFSALLLFGPNVATVVATAGALTPAFLGSQRAYALRPMLIEATLVIVATQIAGLPYRALAGLSEDLVWPWRGLPIVAAAVLYQVAQGALAEVVLPLVTRQPINRAWPKTAFRGCPIYLAGASVSAGLVEAINHRMWEILPVAGASLYFVYRTYVDYVNRLEEAHHRREVIDFLEQGMSVVNADGQVTLWNDALERMLGRSREQVLGRRLVEAVSALNITGVPRALQDTLADRTSRTLDDVRLSTAVDARILQVKLLPVAGGVALLWHDVTERTHAEHELKQTGARLTLAEEGANDALWQWNLRTKEFYVSARWRALVGLPADATIGRPEDWLTRVHAEDVVGLKAALEAHLAGHTEVFQHEHRVRHEDGSYRRFLCRGLAVKGAPRRRDRIAGSFTDTTEHAIAQEQLRSVGFLDPLTGLVNRGIFVEGLGRRLDEFKVRRVSSSFAVLYLDLDRFKIVNDSLGHLVGDELLVAVSRRLELCLRPGDALARLGGDEFAILLSGLGDEGQGNAIAFRIQDALRAPFAIGGREVFTSASIGVAFGPSGYTSPDEVMRDADTAMYHAKSRGKARHEVFDADMHARVRDRLSLENDLRRAIASNDFDVHYQPIVSLTSGMCVGFESLIRWTRNGEAISPATFIPIAEELGLIEPVGTWVLQQACGTFADWQRRFPAAGLECITVNVSSRQLMQHNFLRVVQQAVDKAGLKPADLRVEITETALMDRPGEAAEVLRELRNFGVKVYLDDFGTGYSSLSHLHNLPVDALKIDRSFVTSLLLPGRPAIVESILALARTLNTSVVAEGIESEVQARELERLGCTHAQGYFFSRPLSTQSAEELVKANRPLGPKAEPGKENQPHRSPRTVGRPTISVQRLDAQHAPPHVVEQSTALARV